MTQETAATEQSTTEVAADDTSFESGYAEARGLPPVEVKEEKAEKPEPGSGLSETVETTKPVEKPEEKVETPDPVTALTAQVAALTSQLEGFSKFDQRLKSTEGRIHKYQSTVDQLVKAKDAAASATTTEAKKVADDKVLQKLEQVKADFPEVAELLAEALSKSAPVSQPVDVDAIKADFQKAFDERVSDIESRTVAGFEKARQLAAVDIKHEGWTETINSPEFGAWASKQAPEIQALAESSKAADAIRMLDAYKADQDKAKKQQETKQANADRVARAVAPKGITAPITASITDEEAFELGHRAVRGG